LHALRAEQSRGHSLLLFLWRAERERQRRPMGGGVKNRQTTTTE
jgi:hypothetical protein